MACQAASLVASLREVLKAGPLCQQRTLDPKKISAMALNSTRPERETSLIKYRGAVVMLKCSNRARSLPARIRNSAPKDSTSSASRYIFSASVSLGGGYSLLVLSSVSWPPVATAPQPVMPLVVHRAGTLEAAAHSEVPAERWVDNWCSCVRCGGYEPSII
jgi:hypothetical protein